ncbi:hypothetical protein SPF06_18545 [Sinomonas sp. JGH33]|uniref:Uncharacterized protein n=1 Tax=Sinomonas terricola TaxID=3110330 RepID=A0ABU5TAN2_9MICC|nr:hypothetical protein [Sinomonas sp. JGH33]MEA5456727.1 hypothetical protein [Sinomonas sp. JGH33]
MAIRKYKISREERVTHTALIEVDDSRIAPYLSSGFDHCAVDAHRSREWALCAAFMESVVELPEGETTAVPPADDYWPAADAHVREVAE